MPVRKNHLTFSRRQVAGIILLLAISTIGVAFSLIGNDDFNLARREVLLRRIGHEILLQSGDSVSRVLPVKKIAENEYRISFENELTFQPDFLVKTTQRLLTQDPLAGDYVVNVLNCSDASVAYGYAISKRKKDDIISCNGRRQPAGCYLIDIKFKPTTFVNPGNGYFLGALLLLSLAGFSFLRSIKPKKSASDLPETADAIGIAQNASTDLFPLGTILFDLRSQKLVVNGKSIDLTRTETRLLRIFASSPNELIDRSRLQKEIWEDDGVIVGRSLDMFISKLRKKLDADHNVRIAVVRGKGYKLEITA